MIARPWEPGAATGIGSLPGSDPLEAAGTVLGELPLLPHLPELPGRGPEAGMIGRAAALLVELPAELVPTGWRLTGRAGRDLRRARDLLARDLDALEEAADGYRGPLKLQATGPWTLAASLELPNGHRVVADHGAVRDLAESLAEGLRQHLADVTGRVPGADLVLQLDEPSLPAVLGGRIPTPSGYGTVRAVAAPRAEQTLRDVLSVADCTVVHSCAGGVPLRLLADAGAAGISVDMSLLRTSDYDALGELVDAGVSLWLGAVPVTGATTFAAVRDEITTLWRALGFAAADLATSVVPTPACGLAGATPEQVRRVLRVVRDAGRALRED